MNQSLWKIMLIHLKLRKSISVQSILLIFLCIAPIISASETSGLKVTNVENFESLQQNSKITGVIKDDTGEPIIGAAVMVKGTTKGTITDLDGKFSIDASIRETLIISSVGFKKMSVTITGNEPLSIVMDSDVHNMDEVVVTATGIKRAQKALGYAVTELKGAEIAAAQTVNPVAALQGRAAGVSVQGSDGGVFGSTKIQVRGVSTLSGNTQPIFVVDGVILENNVNMGSEWSGGYTNDFGNSLKNLNADDFESLTVLKGAAATALYGSRGMNGAVVITTKNAEKNRGIGVSVSQTIGVDWVYKVPDIQYEYGPGMFSGLNNYQPNQNKFDNSNFDYEGKNRSIRTDAVAGMMWGPRFDPGIEVIGYDGKLTSYKGYKNNYKDSYDVGFNTSTNLAIQGGNDKSSFYLSDTYQKFSGTFPHNEFDRNSLLLKAGQVLSSYLKVDASVAWAQSRSQNPPFSIGPTYVNGTLSNAYDTKHWKDKWRTSHGGKPNSDYGDEYGSVPGMDLWFELNNRKQVQKQTMVTPIVKLTANITPDITLMAEGNMNYLQTETELKVLGSGYRNQGGEYQLGLSTGLQSTARIVGSYSKTINDFQVGGSVAGEWFFNSGTTTQRQWTNGGLVVPGQYFIGNTVSAAGQESKKGGTKDIFSFYFLANASWKSQIFLDVTGRNDWSSALVYSNGTGNYSYFYPSVSTSWIFSETFDLPDWISFGKVRLSWAQVGNDTDPYRINQAYDLGNIKMPDGGLVYTNGFKDMLIDANLKPERKHAYEAGLDFRVLQGRIGLDLTLYKENTKDQIVNIPAPMESGVSNQLINAGDIQNQGIEVSLKTMPLDTRDFKWNLDFIYTKNNNKIKYLHKDVGEYKALEGSPSYGNLRVGSVAYIGGEYGVLMSDSKSKEFNNPNDPNDPRNGKPLLLWNNNYLGAIRIRSGEVQKVGKMAPDFEGSVNNSFSYKGFYLNALIDMRFGGYMASYSNRYGTAYGLLKSSLEGRDADHGGIAFTSKYAIKNYQSFNDGVIPDGVFDQGIKATGPDGVSHDLSGLTYRDAMDKGYIEPTHASYWINRSNSWSQGVINPDWFSKVKFVALRHVSVGYTLPNSLTKQFKIMNLRVGIEAQNLCYIYNSLPNHLNPESFVGNSNSYSYFEQTFSPYTATYSFNIKFNL